MVIFFDPFPEVVEKLHDTLTWRTTYVYQRHNWMEAASGHTFQSYNPANGESVGSVPAGNDVDTVNAIDAAAAAFPRWSSQTAYERSRFCTWPTA